MLRFLLIFGILLGGTAAVAKPKPVPKRPVMTGAQFKKKMEKVMPEQLCKAKTFFRECYTMPSKSCEKNVTASLNKCMSIWRVPASFKSDNQSSVLGLEIGECIGIDFHKTHVNSFNKKQPKCLAPDQWR